MTAMLTTPNDEKRPSFAAKDIVQFYRDKSELIFPQTTKQNEDDELFDDEAAINSVLDEARNQIQQYKNEMR